MYLWILFRFSALKATYTEAFREAQLPTLMIFITFMLAMILGSLFFTFYSSLKNRAPTSTLLTVALTVASFCFIIPVFSHDESVTFYCFCMFEVCCGIYFPSIAQLKERIIEDRVRANVYAILRIPLNLSVAVGLLLTQGGMQRPPSWRMRN